MNPQNNPSSDSFFIKPLTSFLKDPLSSISSNKISYLDKENSTEYPARRFPASVTRISPLYDENALKEQQKALIGLSDQVRQLKLNNEGLAKDNFSLGKNLDDKDQRIKAYEEIMLKLYNERPQKDPGSLKHKFLTQDQKELDSLMNDILRRKNEGNNEENNKKNDSKTMNFTVNKTKDANIQVDLYNNNDVNNDSNIQPGGLRINLFEQAMGSPKHHRSSPAHGQQFSPNRSPTHSPNRKQQQISGKKDVKLKKIKEIPPEMINSLRFEISNVLNKIKNVNINMTSENFGYTLSLPYFLEEDSQDQIIQFQDFNLYNLSSRLGFGTKIYRGIKKMKTFFNALIEFRWLFKEKYQTLSYSHRELLRKYDEILNFKVRDQFYESFIAFLSLFDDIPAYRNKDSIARKLETEEEESIDRMSTRKIAKFKTKIVNLETKFLVFLIREKLKNHCEIFKLYFTEKRTLNLFFRFRFDRDENIEFFKKNKEFSFFLSAEYLEILRLEPFDKDGLPLSLKFQLNYMSFDEVNKRGSLNKVIPERKSQENVNIIIKREVIEENERKDDSPSKRKQVLEVEQAQKKVEQFLTLKKSFIEKNWGKIQEMLDFSRFYAITKNKLIITKNYRLTPLEIDVYQKFVEKLSFYISNKFILNYDNNHPLKLFSLDYNSPELMKFLKRADFKFLAFVLTQCCTAAAAAQDEKNIEKNEKNIEKNEKNIKKNEKNIVKNYWQQTNKEYDKMWIQARDEFLPLDFFENYVVLPEIYYQNSFHSMANYFNYEVENQEDFQFSKEKTERKMISLLFSKTQINQKIIQEIQNILNFQMLKRNKTLQEIHKFDLFNENHYHSFLLSKDHTGFFQVFSNEKLNNFYSGMKNYLGDYHTLIIISCDFLAMKMKIMVLFGIANFVLMSYFDRFSFEYKLTILIYSFLIIAFFLIFAKKCLRKIQEFKSDCGLVKLQVKQVKNKKEITFIENSTENVQIKYPSNFILLNLIRLIMILYYTFIFLAFFSAKAYISYGFSLVKIEWTKSQTIFKFNKYFDGNHFFPDLFDFLLLGVFVVLYKKIMVSANFIPYFMAEQAIKDWLLTFFRVFCELNNFFQIIFIYPEINNCTLNDCLTMCQMTYKNRLIFYFFYRVFYWWYCWMKFQRFEALNKSLEKTLMQRKAFRDANIVVPNENENDKKIQENGPNLKENKNLAENLNFDEKSKNFDEKKGLVDDCKNKDKILDLENNDVIKLENIEKESPFNMDQKEKGPGRFIKYLHLCQLTNKLVLNSELESLLYSNSVLEKSYEIYIDFYLILLYIISFSSVFSLDQVFFWFILFFESFFIKYKLLFFYKNYHFQDLKQFRHWKHRLFLVILVAAIFNVGLLAFLYDAFFDYRPVLLFFVIVIFICLVSLIGIYLLDDNSEKMKNRLVNNRETLMNFFAFLRH